MKTFSLIFKFLLVGIVLLETALILSDAISKWAGWENVGVMTGSVYPEAITPKDLQTKYHSGRLKILLVAGHDNQYSGTSFGGLREADLNLQLTNNLATILSKDSHFDVITARNFIDGNYITDLAEYFDREREQILSFRNNLQRDFHSLISRGDLTEHRGVQHNFAPGEVSLRLFGINKWANERGVDLVLHVHFNDHPGRHSTARGKYSGFAIYIPEGQYPNARVSAAVAQSVFNQLEKFFPVSDLPLESGGVVEDQELIAVGSSGSRKGASFLIEFGYIYEPQITNEETRPLILAELAWQTYQGLKKHFEPDYPEAPTLLLPHRFASELKEGLRGERDVLALQKLLQVEGLYPPLAKTMNDCPLSGNFGPCTAEAVRAFQTKYNLPTTGYVGELTLEKLNALHSV